MKSSIGKRSKKYWIIPKRASDYQMLAILKILIDKNYDGRVWKSDKQYTTGKELRKLGATRNGARLQPQAVRTLISSLEYLGFLYLNPNTTPHTINITTAGHNFYCHNKNKIKNKGKMTRAQSIFASNDVFHQMYKLQITNPLELKYCQDIFVFPLRFVLALLLKVNYLDREEVALYVFKASEMSELNYVVTEINNFRKYSTSCRKNTVRSFEKSQLGRLSLVKAPSTGYFFQLCESTGLFNRFRIKVSNRSKKIDSISLKSKRKNLIPKIQKLLKKYKSISTFNFKKSIKLWIKYIGNPKELTPPFNLYLYSKKRINLYVIFYTHIPDDSNLIGHINDYHIIHFPIFSNINYNVEIRNSNLKLIKKFKFCASKELKDKNKNYFCLDKKYFKNNPINVDNWCSTIPQYNNNAVDSFDHVAKRLLEHSSSKTFYPRAFHYLQILKRVTGKDYTNQNKDSQLRGAYYECLFYKLLKCLEKKNIINNLIWNGHRSKKYDLPVQARGIGETPDLSFSQDGITYILEVTTIKSNSSQARNEAPSVADHIKHFSKKHNNDKIRAIFCAPKISPTQRTRSTINGTLYVSGCKTRCLSITDKKFIKLFKCSSSQRLAKRLNKIFSTLQNT